MSTADLKFEERERLKKVLLSLSTKRQKEAKEALENELIPVLAKKNMVLSFSNLDGEPDLKEVNSHLLKRGALILPRIEGDRLLLFRVDDLSSLIQNRWGILEPNPLCSLQIAPESVDAALIPGLGFDKEGHRLGRGGGFYDKLLQNLAPSCQTIGIGFKEQHVEALPKEEHDRVLSLVRLY